VLLVFVGHSSDADEEARAIRDLERNLQREFEHLQRVARGTFPFKTVRCWEWNYDAQPKVGGQDTSINPHLDRANIALFVFKERIGQVTWSELERSRRREPPGIPVVAFFPTCPPESGRMSDIKVVHAWAELLEKKRSLTRDWTETDSRSLRPTTDYRDVNDLKQIVLEQMKNALGIVLCPTLAKPVEVLPVPVATGFLGSHPHLTYDRRPVLAHSVKELDSTLIQRFLERPLSREQLRQVGVNAEAATLPDKLTALGCLCDGRPTLGAFLCFAPPLLLANKFEGCSLQMVVYDRTTKAPSSTSINKVHGNLPMLYEEGMSWLTKGAGLKRRGRAGQPDRDELEIPEIVLREALANALVHRDYETDQVRDQPTRLEVFPDRVEVTSFGNLHPSVPAKVLNQDSDNRVTWRRNPVVATIFQHMSLVELNASGVSRMRMEMEKASLAFPKFIADLHESVVRVVLMRPASGGEEPDESTRPMAPQPGQLRAFISSTVFDLPEHRKQAVEACLRQGIFPVSMERAAAEDAACIEISRGMIDKADVFIGVYAWRYGWIPQGSDTSIAEIEFNRAVERGIPILVFLMHNDHPVTRAMVEVENAAQHKLAAFKKRAGKGHVCVQFRSPEELRSQLIQALANLQPLKPTTSSSTGYVPGPLRQLPQAPDLVGRDDELAGLETLLTTSAAGATISGKHAGLQGMGGVGKTALALALAWRLKDRYPDAQLFVTLHGTRQPLTPAAAMQAVIRCFLPDAQLPEEIEQLQPIYNSVLQEGGRRCLLLLDDAVGAEQVTPLLPPPGCLLLVTSRHQFTLPGLTVRNLDCLKPDESVELLLKLAPRIGGDAAAAAELCGHLPLALDVFAGMVNEKTLLPVSELLQRLRGKQATLEKVDAAFAVNCELLDEPLRRRWYRLGVFSASFDLDAAAAVWDEAPQAVEIQAPARPNEHGQPDTPKRELQPEIREAMQNLVNASLVEWNESNGRFCLHNLARDYAARQLTPEEELATRMSHARHFTAVADRADGLYKTRGKTLDGLALFDSERRHIEAAFEFLHSICSSGLRPPSENSAVQPAVRDRRYSKEAVVAACRQLVALVDAVAYTGGLRFHPRHQRVPWLEAQLAAAREIGDRQNEGTALGNLGVAYKNLGDARKAIEYHEQALVIDREIGDRVGEGQDLGNLGTAYYSLGDARKAIEFYEQALVIAREIGDQRGEGAALGNLGNAYADLGDAPKAIEFYEQRLVIAREIGDRRGEGTALGNLGVAYKNLGDAPKAIEYYEQRLVIAREIGDRRGEGTALGNLGVAYKNLGNAPKAIEYYEQALVIDREIGDRRGEGNALGNLGSAYGVLGDARKAIEFFEQHRVIAREIGDRQGEGNALWNYALAFEKLGQRDEAIGRGEDALKIFEQIEDPNAAMARAALAKWKGAEGS